MQNIKICMREAENSNEAVILTDLQGIIKYANKKWLKTCKFKSKDVIGNTNAILQGILTSNEDKKYIENMIKRRKDFSHIITNFKGDNMPFINLLNIVCLTDGFKATVTDLGDIKYTKEYNKIIKNLKCGDTYKNLNDVSEIKITIQPVSGNDRKNEFTFENEFNYVNEYNAGMKRRMRYQTV